MTKRALQEVACRGCGATMLTHLRNRAYCSTNCRLMNTVARSLGRCSVCGERDPDQVGLWLTIDIRSEAERIGVLFADAHMGCRRAELDRAGRTLNCPCVGCRRARGEDTTPTSRAPAGAATRHPTADYLRNRPIVLERDKWVCQICFLQIDRMAQSSEDQAATVDHIQQRWAGGNDDVDNLRAAHRWCNIQRESIWRWGTEALILEAARKRFASAARQVLEP